jgi:hypothetical protein
MVPTQPILIGTAGYSSPGTPPKGWYGAFYPDAKPKGFDELKYYSQIFNTVEINWPRKHWFGVSNGLITHTWPVKRFILQAVSTPVRLAALSSISRLTATRQLELEPLRLLPIKSFLGELHFARSCPPWAFVLTNRRATNILVRVL